MPEVFAESVVTVNAVLAFLGGCRWRHEPARHPIDCHRRGVLMAAIRQRGGEHMDCRLAGGYERNDVSGVGGTYNGPEVDWGCVGRAGRTTVAFGGPRGTPPNNARCR